ncbi:uncharacterized protein N7484_002794 [Penicillium longicatenatum]|uniref:uncharacterized protein n=1 Tax=Penicillium longicatenatum TaxID=1561947 RepID=UPI002548EF71|nr:uncharacterized protein N7484_002794 [Penicillium longicatenatum]KAJ5649071.1 hypothetical protein N7484_002794 [Penicillium longicatenatum]
MTDVKVAVYKPTEKGKLCHWAIWLTTSQPDESIIFQITDNMYGYGYRLADPIYTNPFHTEKFSSYFHCGSIRQENLDCAVDAIMNYPVHNRMATWNCQSWVLECLDMLARIGAMDCLSQGRHLLETLRE